MTCTYLGICTVSKTNGTAFSALATTTPGTGIVTALGVNVGSAGAPVINGGALGTPTSGDVSAANQCTLTTATITGATTLDLSKNRCYVWTLSGNATINASGAVAGMVADVIFVQAASGGPYTVTWGTGFSTPSGFAVDSTASAKTAASVFVESGGTTYDVFAGSASGGSGTVNSGTSGQVAYYGATGTAVSGESLSALVDSAIGNTQGDILYRGASGWSVLAPGTSGQVLQSGGAAANPSWANIATGSDASPDSQAGATYTTTTSDCDNTLYLTSSSAVAVTLAAHASAACNVGATIVVYQQGAGTVTLTGDTGVTILSAGATAATPQSNGQYTAFACNQKTADNWFCAGDLK
jgi:hypothetical protein